MEARGRLRAQTAFLSTAGYTTGWAKELKTVACFCRDVNPGRPACGLVTDWNIPGPEPSIKLMAKWLHQLPNTDQRRLNSDRVVFQEVKTALQWWPQDLIPPIRPISQRRWTGCWSGSVCVSASSDAIFSLAELWFRNHAWVLTYTLFILT
jgi:hypothetical protein